MVLGVSCPGSISFHRPALLLQRESSVQGVEIRCDVTSIALAHAQIRHRREGINPLRVPDPLNHVLRGVRQDAGQVQATGDPIQGRTHEGVGARDTRDDVTGLTPVLPDGHAAPLNVAAGYETRFGVVRRARSESHAGGGEQRASSHGLPAAARAGTNRARSAWYSAGASVANVFTNATTAQRSRSVSRNSHAGMPVILSPFDTVQ